MEFFDAPFIFLFLALIFGGLFVSSLPPLWGLDEVTHFNRAYQISTGTLMEQKIPDSKAYGGAMPKNLVGLSGYTYKDLIDNPHVDNTQITKAYENQRPSSATEEYDFTGANIYPPFVYAASATAIWLSRIFNANLGQIIKAARSATLILYIAFIFSALWLLKDNKSKWLVFLIALLPMSISQAATVSADSLAIGLGLLLFALIVRACNKGRPISWRELIAIVIVGLLIALVKPIYVLLALVTIFLPYLPGKRLSRGRQILLRLVIALVLITPMIIWDLSVRGVAETGAAIQLGSAAVQNVHANTQLLYIIEHPLTFIHIIGSNIIHQDWFGETFGLLGWNYVKIPNIIIGLLVFALALITFHHWPAKEKGRWTGWTLLGSAILTILGFMVFFYVTYNALRSRTINGVQGRYFIPALPFFFYGLGSLIKSVHITMGEYTARLFFSLVSIISLTTAIVVYNSITYK